MKTDKFQFVRRLRFIHIPPSVISTKEDCLLAKSVQRVIGNEMSSALWYPLSRTAGNADVSFFLCKELIPGYMDGITGVYATLQGYFVDEEKADE